MKLVALLLLVGVLLASDVQAEKCDPESAAGALTDMTLVTPLGELGCKVPANVDLAKVMAQLSSNLKAMDLQQLQQLPELIKVVITRSPAELKPFFSLSGKELNALMPVVAGVPADTLKVVMPLLVQQQPATVERMLSFLKGVSRPQLENLSPLFSSITQNQINLMIAAFNALPAHLLEKLSYMVGGLGPVQSVQVANSQQGTMTPVFSIGAGGPRFGPWGGFRFGGGPVRLGFGRKLQQACDPASKGVEAGFPLTQNRNIGEAVCKFGADKLLPVMAQILTVLKNQSPKTLANLPAFSQMMSTTRPEAIVAIAKVPRPTLSALLAIQGANSETVVAQMKTLAAQDAETIDKLVYFTKQTPIEKFGMLINMFGRLNDRQAATMSRLMNGLSVGQIVLSMQLLEKFNFGVSNIEQNIPDANSRGSTFMIGPFVRVTTGGAAQASGVRLPFGFLG